MDGGTSIEFSLDDVDEFAAASHDVNPLHVSASYARKTPYGQRVVHGVLGTLACLGRLERQPDRELASLSVDFPSPMFAGVPYELKGAEAGIRDGKAKLRLYDGRRTLLKLSATFRTRETSSTRQPPADFRVRTGSNDHEDDAFREGLSVSGRYGASPIADQLFSRWRIRGSGVLDGQATALLWASYVIGMELPGTRALFTSIQFDFEPAPFDGPTVFDHEARIESYDERFGVLVIGVRLSIAGRAFAQGRLKAMVRSRKVPTVSIESVLPASDRLKGRLALVTGASRGLGAALAESLVRQGCTVLGNFVESSASIEELGRRLEGASGVLVPTRGDAADAAWCSDVRKIVDERGGLDILVANACPALQPLSIEPAAAERIAGYLAKSFALVSVPMAYLLDSVEARRGRVLIVSSIYARTAPGEWPHYVAAKGAIEGYARSAAVSHPKVSFSIVRPPRLLTDFSDGPQRTDSALPELVAVDILHHLLEPGRLGEAALIERFDLADATRMEKGK